MELFRKEDFEKLSRVEDEVCISIYIPTHESGMEVNEGLDRIHLKNKLQEIEQELESLNYQERRINQLLKPAFQLWEDKNFWRTQSKGLALFLNENEYWIYRIPISFKPYSVINKKFILNPLLPLLEDNLFFTLSISQNKIRLFKNTSFTYEEVNITGLVPKNVNEIYAVYNFELEEKDKNIVREGLVRTPGTGPLPSHGEFPEDDQYKYIMDYLRKIDKGISEALKGQKAPLVISALEKISSLYREANTYDNLILKTVSGNPEYLTERDLHKKSFGIINEKINSPTKKSLVKYSQLAGTGKTSYDLTTILNAAYEGKVESLFVKETNVWGEYDKEKGTAYISDKKSNNSICLLNLCAAKTIENNGKAFLVSDSEMPDTSANSNVAAVFRY